MVVLGWQLDSIFLEAFYDQNNCMIPFPAGSLADRKADRNLLQASCGTCVWECPIQAPQLSRGYFLKVKHQKYKLRSCKQLTRCWIVYTAQGLMCSQFEWWGHTHTNISLTRLVCRDLSLWIRLCPHFILNLLSRCYSWCLSSAALQLWELLTSILELHFVVFRGPLTPEHTS